MTPENIRALVRRSRCLLREGGMESTDMKYTQVELK